MYKVIFSFEDGKTITSYANPGDSLLEIAREANAPIDAPCSGNGACGKCRVLLKEGELKGAKSRHLSEEEYQSGWRLACLSEVVSDVTLSVPDIASAYRDRIRTASIDSPRERKFFKNAKRELTMAGLDLHNSLDLIELSMDPPSLDDTMPDNERLIRALKKFMITDRVEIFYSALKKLPQLLRKSGFQIRCVVESSSAALYVYDVYGMDEPVTLAGLAVDIGTTTVSALLVDMESGHVLAKAGAGNGQIRYGADVINRIIEQGKEGGIEKLQNAIVAETLNPMITALCERAGISPEQICRVSAAGNTTMNHLFAGIYADPVRTEPYIPAFFKTGSIRARDVSLHVNPNARIILSPNIGSYVGGDITSGTLVSQIWNRDEFSLFIDLGTNGELVFGNNEFMMSCACSAGPAFEGGDISCGMRASDGAVESVRIDPESMEPSFSVIGGEDTPPVGLCGSGIIDLIAGLFEAGIINPKGKFIREGARIRRDKYNIARYVLAFAAEGGPVKDIEITEVDIDNFIRAKGAIFSAIRTMLKSVDFDVSMIEHVFVAGGIGSGINMENAVKIGMFPDIALEKYRYVGNASLTGAYLMLISDAAEQKTSELADNMTYLELSAVPGYMDEFVGACFLPHTDTDLFPSYIRREDVCR